MKPTSKTLLAMALAAIISFTLFGCGSTASSAAAEPAGAETAETQAEEVPEAEPEAEEPAPEPEPVEEPETEPEEEPAAPTGGLTLGSTFEFDDLEITFGTDLQWTTSGERDVFYVPVTTKNLKDSEHSLNIFYLTTYGPDGEKLPDVSMSFALEAINYVTAIPPGEEETAYMFFVYDGDGTYTASFKALLGIAQDVSFEVTK